MIKNWVTFGMSEFVTPGFQDTSRLMTGAWSGAKIYVQPPKPFSAWKKLDGKVLQWEQRQIDGVTVLQPPLPVPSRMDPLRWSVKLHAATLNREMTGYLGGDWRDTSIVYVTNWTPYLQPMISQLRPKYLVVDFVDDILKFPYKWDANRVSTQLAQLTAESCVVVAVSPALQDQIQRNFQQSCAVLPNAVNETFFTAPRKVPEVVNSLGGRIRIGFAGTLNHWIDFQSVKNLANMYPENAFVLMGKRGHIVSAEQQQAFEELQEMKNVHFLGPVLYNELPAYLHNMDVLLLPRCPSESSEASSPLKLYEYLAVGKPVVTSGFPIPAAVRQLVYHSPTEQGLVSSMKEAIQELQSNRSRLKREQRQAFAKQHTWEKRIQWIAQMVEESETLNPVQQRGANRQSM
ncbi:glycosyltransferase [Alicyclobacillus tolerans]|uniref:glycosyltransferase n=1 Tax=Alicyclobacillus tolerans TaxID=90970 RepID=UPI001F49249D|nr:glycosyltransferase [Alicyclobacillus tolerans]MCF8564157.1 glycosyltransferase [Alicyclobacillus tolerans]